MSDLLPWMTGAVTGRVADFVVEAQVLGQRQYILQPVHDQVESE